MEKVIKAALTAKYPSIDISQLMEVINATPNSVIATEILLGVYEDPQIPYRQVNNKRSEGILTFVSYDKWKDVVNYSYNWVETKNDYFPKSVKKEDVNMENYQSLRCPYKENETHVISWPTGITATKKSYVNLSEWNGYEGVEPFPIQD